MDIEIVIAVAIAAAFVAFLIWLTRLRRRALQEPVNRGGYGTLIRPSTSRYNPGVTVVEINTGFSEGMILGTMMNAGEYSQPNIVINETIVAADPPAFSGFGGGGSDGGGATSGWAPSESPSSDSGSSDISPCSGDS